MLVQYQRSTTFHSFFFILALVRIHTSIIDSLPDFLGFTVPFALFTLGQGPHLLDHSSKLIEQKGQQGSLGSTHYSFVVIAASIMCPGYRHRGLVELEPFNPHSSDPRSCVVLFWTHAKFRPNFDVGVGFGPVRTKPMHNFSY